MHEVEGYMDDNQNMSDVDCDVIDEGHDQITITNHNHPITMQSHQQDIIYYHNKQSNRKHAPGNRVACPECQKPIHPSSLSRHLADIHNKGTKYFLFLIFKFKKKSKCILVFCFVYRQ